MNTHPINLFLAGGQPRTVDGVHSTVKGVILGGSRPTGRVKVAPGLRLADIMLEEPLEEGQLPFITAFVREPISTAS